MSCTSDFCPEEVQCNVASLYCILYLNFIKPLQSFPPFPPALKKVDLKALILLYVLTLQPPKNDKQPISPYQYHP